MDASNRNTDTTLHAEYTRYYSGGIAGKIYALVMQRLNKNKIQRFFANDVIRRADKYTPFKTGVMKNTARVINNGKSIEYVQPYSVYQWYGKEWWNFSNNESGLRGPYWINRMWADEGDEIIKEVEAFVNGNN